MNKIKSLKVQGTQSGRGYESQVSLKGLQRSYFTEISDPNQDTGLVFVSFFLIAVGISILHGYVEQHNNKKRIILFYEIAYPQIKRSFTKYFEKFTCMLFSIKLIDTYHRCSGCCYARSHGCNPSFTLKLSNSATQRSSSYSLAWKDFTG